MSKECRLSDESGGRSIGLISNFFDWSPDGRTVSSDGGGGGGDRRARHRIY